MTEPRVLAKKCQRYATQSALTASELAREDDAAGAREGRQASRVLNEVASVLEQFALFEEERSKNLQWEMQARAECLERIAKLEAALKRWHCEAGCIRGTVGDQYDSKTCHRCDGTGLHPVACEALRETP